MLGDYFEFWAIALGVDARAFALPGMTISRSGNYLRKHDGCAFLFTELETGKQVLAAPESVNAPPDSKPEFYDLDLCLSNAGDFTPLPQHHDIRRIDRLDDIEDLLSQCNEDDVDTLDLDPEADYALAIYLPLGPAGVARFTKVKSYPQIADITVLVSPLHRGKGLAAPLVSALVEEILRQGLTPKYRAAITNSASLAVGQKLGFKALFSLKTWNL